MMEWTLKYTYYGSAQVGHLYFFGSAAQTPQRASDIKVAELQYAQKSIPGISKSIVKEKKYRKVMLKMTFGPSKEKIQALAIVPKGQTPAANFDALVTPPKLPPPIVRPQQQCLSDHPCDSNRYAHSSLGHVHRVRDHCHGYRAPAMRQQRPYEDGSPLRKSHGKVMYRGWTRCMRDIRRRTGPSCMLRKNCR